jgi:hypothetical protein
VSASARPLTLVHATYWETLPELHAVVPELPASSHCSALVHGASRSAVWARHVETTGAYDSAVIGSNPVAIPQTKEAPERAPLQVAGPGFEPGTSGL